jgi:cytochrome P450
MSLCPHANLLHLDNFAKGTPREEIARLRDEHRLVWQEDEYERGGHWLVLQSGDIDTVLKTPADFSNNYGPLLEDFPEEFLTEQQESMTFMDPPRHRTYRSLVDYAFRPKNIATRRPHTEAIAREIVDRVIGRGECEFIAEVALPLPVTVMFRLLGVPDEDFDRVVSLTNTLAMANDPDYAADRMEGFIASLELMQFGEALAERHLREPRDSMTMEMLSAEVEGHKLDPREFGRFFVNLIVGGVETTRNTLGWLFYQLIKHPDQLALLQSEPERITSAVEEALRHSNTVVYLRRTATRDMVFAGEAIKQGDKLVCILGSPNRDPRLFDNPDVFDITRDPARNRRHYRTFGAGPHFCVGVHQARQNLEVMSAELLTRMDNFRLLEEPTHSRSNFMDGFKSMPIAFAKRGSQPAD